MFEKANVDESVDCDTYAIVYNHWPSPFTLNLTSIDEQIDEFKKIKKNSTEMLKFELKSENDAHAKEVPVVDIFKFITEHYHGLVISGSDDSCVFDRRKPYLDKTLLPLIRSLLSIDFPMFGICFGAQAIVSAHYGDAVMSTMKKQNKLDEFGYTRLRTLKQDEILRDVPSEFVSGSYHSDCFVLKEGESIIGGDNWYSQAFHIPGKRAYGVQFHPEYDKEIVDECLEDVKVIYGIDTPVFLDANEPDMQVGRTMARNFINLSLNK
ncbi:hypothetical protein AKO1_007638 [Acrasis kona]|uniref:Glutamine amidotransferase domain-containing protein n=1 Tax=Acrasis kona TaxID=1008807 RepID=A0AAW2YRF7_9EUKA